jgi:hypothetical protein
MALTHEKKHKLRHFCSHQKQKYKKNRHKNSFEAEQVQEKEKKSAAPKKNRATLIFRK